MRTQFLKHAWLQFRRSPTLTQNVIQTVVLGLFGLYFLVIMLMLPFILRKVVEDEMPQEDFFMAVCGFLGFYFLSDLISRFFLQKFPVLAIKPYMALPIKRSQIVQYLLNRSMLNFFNFLPLFFFIPFIFIEIFPNYPEKAVGFILFSLGMILLNNFLAFGITKNMSLKGGWSGAIIVSIFVVFFLDYQGYFSLFDILKNSISAVIAQPLLSAIPLALAALLYGILFQFFKKQLYLENTKSEKQLLGANLSFGWFDRFGEAGKLMDLELKLMMRSKRARAYVLASFVLVIYPLFFLDYQKDYSDSPYVMLLVGLALTGMIAFNHGQLMLSWNSLHFDLLMSRGNTVKDLFKAKYYILALSCVFSYVLTLPYFFLFPLVPLYALAMLLFNATISVFGYMYLASYNSLRIDPNAGGAFSMDGFGAAHFLIGIPLIAVPCVIFFLGYEAGGKVGGLVAVGGTGLLGLLFNRQILDAIVDNFKENRYKLAAAFRKTQ
ncbi:MAG: DUF5687 family protein [Bacteroidota bacterium]